MRRLSLTLLVVFSLSLLASLVHAEGAGQKDLDEAADLQVGAETLADFEKVIALAESALKKGLDKGQEEFAHKMAAATLYQHAERSAKSVLEPPRNPSWQLVRQIALKNLEKAKKHDPKLPDVYLLIARLHAEVQGGDEKLAKEAMDEGIKLLKDNPQELAKAYILRGRIVEGLDAKFENFDAAVKADPKNVQALQGRAIIYSEKGENDKAIADLTQLLEADANNQMALEAISQVLNKLKKYDEALKHIEKIISLDPNQPKGYLLRASLYAMKEDEQKALADLDKALELDPRNLLGLLMRSQVHAAMKNYDKAKKDSDLLLRLVPDLPDAILLRSRLAASEKKFGLAIAEIKKLLHSDPKNEEYRLQMAMYLAADKRPRKAIEILDNVIADNEKNADALRSRGDALLSIGKHAEAIADYEKSLKIDPKDTGVLNNLAWVLATSKDDKVRDGKKSIEYGKQACELTEYKKPHILSTLASGYAETGDFETAIKWSTKAVELGKGTENDDQLHKELEGYKERKPWREEQIIEENKAPLEPGKDDLET
ncbi:MAG: tetratricopeptide repeat protein [Planctomycetales bacterium]|nr:tetratricopeptide repeat protein [Planctomycetales bacterium]